MAQGVIWYDASIIIGNVGDTVTNVANSGSGSWGGALSVPASAAGPTIATVDGLQMLKFTQNSPNFQRLVSTGLGAGNVLSGNKTYFLVAQYDSSGNDKGRIFSSTRAGATDNWLLGHHTARSCIAYTAAMPVSTFINGVEASSSYATSPYQSGRYVYCLAQATSGGLVTSTMYVNGIFKGTLTATALQAQTPTNFSIGGCGPSNSNDEMSDCFFCEARVYNSALNLTDIQSITTTLSNKWGTDALAPPTTLTPTGTVTIANRAYDSTITINASQITSSLSLVGVTGIDPTKPVAITSLSASYPSSSAGAKSVTVTGVLSDTANYTLATLPQVNTTITAAPLTATTTVNNKVYDGGLSATTGSVALSGVIGSDAVSATASASFGTNSVANGKAVTITYSIGGAAAGNYSLSNPSGSGTANITIAPLTASGITVPNKVYDGTTSATASGTVALGGVVSGDAVSATATASFGTNNVGTDKGVTITYSLGGAAAGNYSLAPGSALANITAVILSVAGVTANSKVFDGTTTTTTSGTPSLTGVVNSESVTVAVSSANFDTPIVGTDKPVTVAFTLSGTTSGNYTLANIILTADITAVPTPAPTPITAPRLVSLTTNTAASSVTSHNASISMRASKAQGTFKPASYQDWIRYLKG